MTLQLDVVPGLATSVRQLATARTVVDILFGVEHEVQSGSLDLGAAATPNVSRPRASLEAGKTEDLDDPQGPVAIGATLW